MLKKTLKIAMIAVSIMLSSYCYGQSVNIQQQQQNVNINLPVIEKTVYVDRYRTVYIDKPQPKRLAKKLAAPVQLLGYLWVYTEDLGNFKQPPLEVIRNINAQNPYGRNNWRIPTPDELAVMENNADKVGLGDDIYLATDHSNGVLRLVSTGKSVAEQNAETAEQERYAAEQARIRAAQEAEQRRIAEENARKEQMNAVTINGVVWATRNIGNNGNFVSSPEEYGSFYTWEQAKNACPNGWRLPTKDEFDKLANTSNIITSKNGIEGYVWGNGNNTLFLPFAGYREYDSGIISGLGMVGRYWSSTSGIIFNAVQGRSLIFGISMKPRTNIENQGFGFCVRCVKE